MSIRVGFQINGFDNGIQIDRAINVGKKFPFGNAWGRSPARRRFPFQVRGKKRGFDHEQEQTTLSLIIFFDDRQDLGACRAMDKSFALEAFGSIFTMLMGFTPGGTRGYMIDHQTLLSHIETDNR
jgi:hypothetical protein